MTSLRTHFDFTTISHRMSLRFNFALTSVSLRLNLDFTLNSLRLHFDVTSDSHRCHFDLTSVSLLCHFDFPSIPQRCFFELTFSLRFHFYSQEIKGERHTDRQRMRECSTRQKGKEKGQAQLLISNSDRQPDCDRACTSEMKQNKFLFGRTPQTLDSNIY